MEMLLHSVMAIVMMAIGKKSRANVGVLYFINWVICPAIVDFFKSAMEMVPSALPSSNTLNLLSEQI